LELPPELIEILTPAYSPCPRRKDACGDMRWEPERGFMPRGFLGAVGDITEVELVLVSAEPGDPWEDEQHDGFSSALDYTFRAFSNRESIYHKNMRKILDMCWPDTSFEEQLRKTWITDSVLCSAPKECGPIKKRTYMACGKDYLLPQLRMFPQALVVAIGSKARDRLRLLGVSNFLDARAAAPSGCNLPDAQETWARIARTLQERRQT